MSKKSILVGNIGRAAPEAQTVTVGGITSHVVKIDGRPVVTTRQLAAFLGCDAKHLDDNYRNNRDRFREGVHFVKLSGESLRAFKNQPENIGLVAGRSSHLIVWTERGAARHAKALSTEKAWSIFEALEDAYFRRQQAAQSAASPKIAYAVGKNDSLSLEQANTLRDTLETAAKAFPPDARGGFLREGWSRLKAHFKCHYRDIPAQEFDEAVSLLTRHVLRHDPMQEQPAIGYVRPDARAVLLDATNALAHVVPVLAELVSRGEPANDAVRGRRSL